MNKKLVMLPIVVLLAALFVGKALAPAVNACTYTLGYYGNGPSEPVSFDWSTAYLKSVDFPIVISSGNEWQCGDELYVRDLVIQDNFVLADNTGNCLAVLAIFQTNSNVDLKTDSAIIWISIKLVASGGWWQGKLQMQGTYNPDNNFFDSNGRCQLCANGGWTGWPILSNVSTNNGGLDFSGQIWDPCTCSWISLGSICSFI